MSAESLIFSTLRGLVGDRVYPDAAPNGTARPFIVYYKVGGTPVQFCDGTLASKRNGRYQIDCCSTTRAAANLLASQVESAMVSSVSLRATVLSEPIYESEPDVGWYETKQDFSVWCDR